MPDGYPYILSKTVCLRARIDDILGHFTEHYEVEIVDKG